MSSEIESEERYVQRIDAEKKAKLKALLASAATADEQAALVALVKNRCGRCGDQMQPKIFKGVEIDICPGCGAVLLDPGELEELAGKDESHKLAFLSDFFSSTTS